MGAAVNEGTVGRGFRRGTAGTAGKIESYFDRAPAAGKFELK
jgi:hypothetical protein